MAELAHDDLATGWLAPFAAARRRIRAWWLSRLPITDTLLLGQGNIYILPTRAGLMFGATLLVLLIASINYQLSLGYLLTFLLAGTGAVAMHITHGTLRGLTLHLRAPAAVFANSAALLDITLTSPGSARFGIGLRMNEQGDGALGWVDVAAHSQASARVSFVPLRRGLRSLPTIRLETRFPLGLFKAWALWRPAAQLLVYPEREHPAPPLPAAQATAGQSFAQVRSDAGEVEGIRAYRRGDPLKLIAWKKTAGSLAAGGELVSRDTSSAAQMLLWLDWQRAGMANPEVKLSRLAAWVVAAEGMDISYGLRLPGAEIEPSHGEHQQRACLRALALHEGASSPA